MASSISIALCADKNIEIGLHITLYSLLETSQSPLKINLVQKGYESRDVDKLHKTLRPFDGNYELNIVNFDEQHLFGKYKGLHGNKFPFTKLMLASLLSDDKVLYLDSDLLIRKDLSSLFVTDLKGHILGVSGIESIGSSLRSKFYTSIGMKEEAPYFNSGVMMMDLIQWRQQDITKRCIEFADCYADRLVFADEAILNCVFYENNFHILDSSFNHALYPTSPSILANDLEAVFHFVGSPKPWDFLGEILHQNYALSHKIGLSR